MAQLKRQIGLRTAAALVVGEVIAVGIFLTPADMAKQLGSPMWLLIVWLVMGAMALCGALCYAELAARYPDAGGGFPTPNKEAALLLLRALLEEGAVLTPTG